MAKIKKYQVSTFKSFKIEEIEEQINDFLAILTDEGCAGQVVDIKWAQSTFDHDTIGAEVLFSAIVIFEDMEEEAEEEINAV